MRRVTRSSAAKATTAVRAVDVPVASSPPQPPASKRKHAEPPKTPSKRVKTEITPVSPDLKRIPRLEDGEPLVKAEQGLSPDTKEALKVSPPRQAALQAKKLRSLSQYAARASPFPDFPYPTPTDCRKAHAVLAELHGARVRPAEVKASAQRAGCGDSPSVLDALVRTILSQNTSDANSTRAKLSMDKVYGGSDEWEAIVAGGQPKLQEAIKCGGLSAVKSRVILAILTQVKEKYGVYSLDHLFGVSNDEAMQELVSFQGVGPKTASCVLLFCLKRDSFAVDTHVWRITGLLGWRPAKASRDETFAHLDARIPDEEKYGLHILLVTHGKRCEECKAGGRSAGKCKLRKLVRRSDV